MFQIYSKYLKSVKLSLLKYTNQPTSQKHSPACHVTIHFSVSVASKIIHVNNLVIKCIKTGSFFDTLINHLKEKIEK